VCYLSCNCQYRAGEWVSAESQSNCFAPDRVFLAGENQAYKRGPGNVIRCGPVCKDASYAYIKCDVA
jgi:hypothetical protein